MSKFSFFFFLLILTACSSNTENRVNGDNLTVYFPNVKNQNLAEKVAVYWKNNDLITGANQDLQLINTEKGYQLNLIQSDLFKDEPINFEDQKLLSILRDSLENKIFNTNFTIAICNNKFVPIYKVN